MKRYLLFCLPDYRPAGGMKDCHGAFQTIRECEERWDKLREDRRNHLVHAHIYDFEKNRIIMSWDSNDGFWRETEIHPLDFGPVSWSW